MEKSRIANISQPAGSGLPQCELYGDSQRRSLPGNGFKIKEPNADAEYKFSIKAFNKHFSDFETSERTTHFDHCYTSVI